MVSKIGLLFNNPFASTKQIHPAKNDQLALVSTKVQKQKQLGVCFKSWPLLCCSSHSYVQKKLQK
jgi:hypothetical protein